MSNCKYAGRGEPRILPGRHSEECPSEATGADLSHEQCSGCLPCPERHCPVCQRAHADGACAECIAATRDDLAAIRLMCGALPEEVRHRGVNGEAAVLFGPSANPEARAYVEASYLAGRLPEGWIEASHGKNCSILRNEACVGCAGGELHPMIVLGSWEMVWRDHLDMPTDLRATVHRLADFLGRKMHVMAAEEEVPFEDFATDLRRCRAHLEAVLHDQAQGDLANVGCFECGGDLERKLTDRHGFEDHWTCQRCRRKYTQPEYNFALRAALEKSQSKESTEVA